MTAKIFAVDSVQTLDDFERDALRIAAVVRDSGVGLGDRVMLKAGNSAAYVCVLLCSNLIGPSKTTTIPFPFFGHITFLAGVLFFFSASLWYEAEYGLRKSMSRLVELAMRLPFQVRVGFRRSSCREAM